MFTASVSFAIEIQSTPENVDRSFKLTDDTGSHIIPVSSSNSATGITRVVYNGTANFCRNSREEISRCVHEALWSLYNSIKPNIPNANFEFRYKKVINSTVLNLNADSAVLGVATNSVNQSVSFEIVEFPNHSLVTTASCLA